MQEKRSLVYVTKTGKAYHGSRDCAYLDLSIRTVSLEEVRKFKNKNGSKYVRCGSCCKRRVEKPVTLQITEPVIMSFGMSGIKANGVCNFMDKVGKRHPCKKCT